MVRAGARAPPHHEENKEYFARLQRDCHPIAVYLNGPLEMRTLAIAGAATSSHSRRSRAIADRRNPSATITLKSCPGAVNFSVNLAIRAKTGATRRRKSEGNGPHPRVMVTEGEGRAFAAVDDLKTIGADAAARHHAPGSAELLKHFPRFHHVL